jgi:hypothetical protein
MLNQNFKVMKQKIFTLVLMFALVIMAGSAFAAAGDNKEPYQGGTYLYTVNPITLITAGTAGISFSGFTTDPTISEPKVNAVAATGTNPYNIATGGVSFTFKLAYSSTEPTTGTHKIIVTATEGGGSGCTNVISLNVVITAKPTLTLTLAAATPSCSNVDGTTTDGTADGHVGATANTFTYTVTPGSMTGITNYAFTFGLDAYTFGSVANAKTAGTSTGGASASAPLAITAATDAQTITITYNTVEGAGTTFTGSLSSATFTLPAATGGGTYPCTISGNNATAVVKDVPTIGTFN